MAARTICCGVSRMPSYTTSIPQSRARTAICSAPLEWPSSPGLPTSSLIRRPSRARNALDLAHALPRDWHRVASRWPDRFRSGARYSPKTPRSVCAPFTGRHTGLGASNRRLHDVAAVLRDAPIRPTPRAAASVAPARQAASRAICSASMAGIDHLDRIARRWRAAMARSRSID